ncbi:hypothetical protein [Streptomyces aureoversilis]|uniref:Uncharacterized protein n=1 Tax=Streptomyces aureoversilis TaxID=67277 RepID=A0ABV9ZTY6_9ACTN
MPIASLAVTALLGLTGVAARALLQRHRTGESGMRWPSGTRHWCAWLVSVGGILLAGIAAPLAELGGLRSLPVLDHSVLRMARAALAALSTGVVFACQQAMGASWRLHPTRVSTPS